MCMHIESPNNHPIFISFFLGSPIAFDHTIPKLQRPKRVDTSDATLLFAARSDSENAQTELSAIEEFNNGLTAQISALPI